jgi:PAS domain S-box-containing protein
MLRAGLVDPGPDDPRERHLLEENCKNHHGKKPVSPLELSGSIDNPHICPGNHTATVLRGDEYELLELLPGPVVAADRTGMIVWANIEACDLLNYEHPDELVGVPLSALIPQRLLDRHLEAFRRYIHTGDTRLVGKRVHLRALTQSGQELPVELSLRVLRRHDGTDLMIGSLLPADPAQDIIDFSIAQLEEGLQTPDHRHRH